MRPTGIRSNTRLAGPFLTLVLVACASLLGARNVRALDVFTLWRQPELPLHITEGDWADYRSQTLAGGRREESLTRIVCLDRADGSDEKTWLLELLPLVEEDGTVHPAPGEGVQLRVSRDLLRRTGDFLDLIVDARQWRSGQGRNISRTDLRDDPLVAATLDSDFRPDTTERRESTTRIVSGEQFLCDQFVMSAADTQRAQLPAGLMVQVTTRQIVAASHPDIPFLGLAYVSERVRSDSHVEPASRRFRAPPARVRVEVMELVDFGHGAHATLKSAD